MQTYKKFLHRFFNSFFFETPLLCSSILILVKVLLEMKNMNIFSLFIIASIVFQNIICLKKQWFLKFIKKKVHIPHLISLITYLLSLYSVHYQGSQIFIGLEIAIVFISNSNEILRIYYRVLFILSLTLCYLKMEELNLLYIIHYLFLIYFFDKLSRKFIFIENSNKHTEIQQAKDANEKRASFSLHLKGKCKANKQEEFIKKNSRSLTDPKENLVNLIDLGIILIDEELNFLYMNPKIAEMFNTKDEQTIKNIVYEMKENNNFQDADSTNLFDSGIQSIYDSSWRFSAAFENYKSDEKHDHEDNLESNVPSTEANKGRPPLLLLNSKEKLFAPFEKWRKRCLSESQISPLRFSMINSEKKSQNTMNKVIHHLQNIVHNYKSNINPNLSKSEILLDFLKSSIYAIWEAPNVGTEEFFIRFTPLKKVGLNETEGNIEKLKIIITIRQLTDVEKKNRKSDQTRIKLFGSFCKDLRTSFNENLNALETLRNQINSDFSENFKKNNLLSFRVSENIMRTNFMINEIDNFIDYCSFTSNNFHTGPFSLCNFFQEIEAIFEYGFKKKKLNFSIEYDKEMPNLIYNDKNKLKQIMINLLSKYFSNILIIFFHIENSIEFTDEGAIKIKLKLIERNLLQISLVDSGIGMKPEKLDNLGNFYQEGSFKGLGLCVSNILCHAMVKDYYDFNSGLTVYSEHEKGTCFTFNIQTDLNHESEIRPFISMPVSKEKKLYSISISNEKIENIEKKTLPCEKFEIAALIKEVKHESLNKLLLNPLSSPTRLPSALSDSEAISNQSIIKQKSKIDTNCLQAKFFFNPTLENDLQPCKCAKVLIIDNNADNIKNYRQLLRRKQILCHFVESGKEAIVKVESCLLNSKRKKFCRICKFYKIILIEIALPEKNGLEVAEEINILLKNTEISTKIIGLWEGTQEKKNGCIEHFVEKPLDFDKMEELINNYL